MTRDATKNKKAAISVRIVCKTSSVVASPFFQTLNAIERWPPKPEVTGSTPVGDAFLKCCKNNGLRLVCSKRGAV